MKRRLLATALTLSMLLGICGCSRSTDSEASQKIALPEPSEMPVDCFLGEQKSASNYEVTLYSITGDESSFSAVKREITADDQIDCCESALDMLLHTINMLNTAEKIAVTDLEVSCGIATVQLDLVNPDDEQSLLTTLASIGNTLLSLNFIDAVNVLVGSHAENIAALPYGVQTEIVTGVTPAYAQLSTEHTFFLDSETGTIQRNAVLYYPSADGSWFVPEIRSITFDSTDYASALIRALRDGSANECVVTAVPENEDLLLDNPSTEVTSSGERVLSLNFSSDLVDYLTSNHIEQWQFIGSLTLTLCSFVPEIDAIRILLDGQPVSSCLLDGSPRVFSASLIRRTDFTSKIGGTVSLCIADRSGNLSNIHRAVSPRQAQSPAESVALLLDDSDGIFSDSVSSLDLLGVRVENGVASVNLSANFYRAAQSAEEVIERGMIFSIVNTLCSFDEISAVRFYIEGIASETLSGAIYLKSELLPYPLQTISADVTATP